jgi:hypothetical protein
LQSITGQTIDPVRMGILYWKKATWNSIRATQDSISVTLLPPFFPLASFQVTNTNALLWPLQRIFTKSGCEFSVEIKSVRPTCCKNKLHKSTPFLLPQSSRSLIRLKMPCDNQFVLSTDTCHRWTTTCANAPPDLPARTISYALNISNAKSYPNH